MQIKRLSETLCSVIWLAETIWNARNVVETQTLCHDFKTHPKRINGQEKRNRYCILTFTYYDKSKMHITYSFVDSIYYNVACWNPFYILNFLALNNEFYVFFLIGV